MGLRWITPPMYAVSFDVKWMCPSPVIAIHFLEIFTWHCLVVSTKSLSSRTLYYFWRYQRRLSRCLLSHYTTAEIGHNDDASSVDISIYRASLTAWAKWIKGEKLSGLRSFKLDSFTCLCSPLQVSEHHFHGSPRCDPFYPMQITKSALCVYSMLCATGLYIIVIACSRYRLSWSITIFTHFHCIYWQHFYLAVLIPQDTAMVRCCASVFH
jgi:hypothetical protein